MSKVSKMVGVLVFAVITVLFLQSGLLGVTASASEEQEVISPEITEVEISEEGQQLELEKGEEYKLSYLVDGEGWNFEEIKYRLNGSENWEIYDIDLYDDENENEHVVIEKAEENETDRVSLKVKCKTNDLSDIGVFLLNELTGETKEYASQTVVVDKPEPTPKPEPDYPNQPEEPEQPDKPEQPEEPDEPDQPEEPKITLTEENLVINEDGSFAFRIPEGALPEGAVIKYKVNGVEVDDDYSLSGTGAYIITATYTLPGADKENEAKAIFNVGNEETNAEYTVDLEQAETETGKVGVTVHLSDIHTSQGLIGFQFDVEYDKGEMTYDTAEANSPEWDFAFINGLDKGMATTNKSFISGDTEVATFIFELKDEDATDIILNVKNPYGPDRSNNKHYADDVSIVLNPSAPQYKVTVPKVENGMSVLTDIAKAAIPSQVEESEDDEDETEENVSSMPEDTSDDEQDGNHSDATDITAEAKENDADQENTSILSESEQTETESKNMPETVEESTIIPTSEPTDIDQNASIPEEVETEE